MLPTHKIKLLNDYLGWYFYDEASHAVIESHFAKGATTCDIRIGSVGYQINFKTMMQTNALNALKTRPIKRGTSNQEESLNPLATIVYTTWHYVWHPVTAVNKLYSMGAYVFEKVQRRRHA